MRQKRISSLYLSAILFRFNINNLVNLNEIKDRQLVRVEDTLGQKTNYKLLMSYGIFKGTELTVIRNDRWQGMILVEFEGRRIAIRRADASCIKVEPLHGK